MDWGAPYRADVQDACQAVWHLARVADAARLPAAVARLRQALCRWLLLPTHLPDARQHLAALLTRTEQLYGCISQETAQPVVLAAWCAQVQQLILELQSCV